MKELKKKNNTTNKTKKTTIMKTKKEIVDERPRFKVKIDYKTVITVRTMDAVKAWQQRYPEAKLVA